MSLSGDVLLRPLKRADRAAIEVLRGPRERRPVSVQQSLPSEAPGEVKNLEVQRGLLSSLIAGPLLITRRN